jgi:hypothetical protein
LQKRQMASHAKLIDDFKTISLSPEI